MSETSLIINYPLEDYYSKRNKYIYQIHDDPAIDEELHKKLLSYFDISDTISFFPHLELDPDYRLICYLQFEYHGVCGEVAAVKNGEDAKPFPIKSRTLAPHLKLPDAAISPREAIYNDGTPEGYLEAVLCNQFFYALTNNTHGYYCSKYIIDAPPVNFNEFYTATVSISDWRPRFAENRVTVFKETCQHMPDFSDEGAYISLTEYTFYDNLEQYRYHDTLSLYRFGLGSLIKDLKPYYKNTIKDDSRYNSQRHCCMFHSSKTLIAEKNKTQDFL